MVVRIAAILWVLLAPTALSAELNASECLRIQQLLNKLPSECLQASANPNELGLKSPAGAVKQNHIFFPAGGSELDPNAIKQLYALSRALMGQVMGDTCLQLIGHSDTSGGTAANERLGQLRAEKVAEYLDAQLRNSARIQDVTSVGETQPLNGFAPQNKWQRRVEIRARKCSPVSF
ncbi:OmpA family protein [Cognatishimia activa]|uniref:OmpA family protein n=1 Tax=Cognatishimia activa TaxID=1715691 RepID=UPI0022303FC7|nr:OmpA family protein [Cognatishimia activa]UZD90047.1 OmpA family protein [Cognatishimia activa]